MSENDSGSQLPAVAEDPLSPMLSPEALGQLMQRIHEVKRDLLKDGHDYAVIPGTAKPSLLKPGAEKLCQFFGYRISAMEMEHLSDGPPFGILYKCVLHDARGRIVGVCDGWCDDGEKGRRGSPRNTIIKMAQKRAFVGAALIACNASELFTMDMEDYVDGEAVESTSVVVDGDGVVVDDKPQPKAAGKKPPRNIPDGYVTEEEHGVNIYTSLVEYATKAVDGDEETAKRLVGTACKDCGFSNTDELGKTTGSESVVKLKINRILKDISVAAEQGDTGLAEERLVLLANIGLDPDALAEVIKGAGCSEWRLLSEDALFITVRDAVLKAADALSEAPNS